MGGGAEGISIFPIHSEIISTSGALNILTTPVQIAGTEMWHLALGWHFILAGMQPAGLEASRREGQLPYGSPETLSVLLSLQQTGPV